MDEGGLIGRSLLQLPTPFHQEGSAFKTSTSRRVTSVRPNAGNPQASNAAPKSSESLMLIAGKEVFVKGWFEVRLCWSEIEIEN